MAGLLSTLKRVVGMGSPDYPTPLPLSDIGFVNEAILPALFPQLEPEPTRAWFEKVFWPQCVDGSLALQCPQQCYRNVYPFRWSGLYPVYTQDPMLHRILLALQDFFIFYKQASRLEHLEQPLQAYPCYKRAYIALRDSLAYPWPPRRGELEPLLVDNLAKSWETVKRQTPNYKLHWLLLPTTAAIAVWVLQAELVRTFYECHFKLNTQQQRDTDTGLATRYLRMEYCYQRALEQNNEVSRRLCKPGVRLLDLSEIESRLLPLHAESCHWLSVHFLGQMKQRNDVTYADLVALSDEACATAQRCKSHSHRDVFERYNSKLKLLCDKQVRQGEVGCVYQLPGGDEPRMDVQSFATLATLFRKEQPYPTEEELLTAEFTLPSPFTGD
jgi:hypothetical protein